MDASEDRWSDSLEGVCLLDRYEVERAVGGGGMASVYLGHDSQLDTPVVVKVPHAAAQADGCAPAGAVPRAAPPGCGLRRPDARACPGAG